MKISCPFCHVEYAAPLAAGRPVSCAVCGHVFIAKKKKERDILLWLSAGIMMLAALVFVFVIAIKYLPHAAPADTLVIDNITATEAGGRWTVSGNINNRSGHIHGIPEMVVRKIDASGTDVGQNRFMPPAPLIYIDETIAFRFNIQSVPEGTARMVVEFIR
ncbi:MAG: zinc-ribbon domain-containing protein [Alphaproteobacteria bacterium]|nr:zinc-ribbon domain-containing protein [Alphaproteobacteria bacterium]